MSGPQEGQFSIRTLLLQRRAVVRRAERGLEICEAVSERDIVRLAASVAPNILNRGPGQTQALLINKRSLGFIGYSVFNN